jgi:transcriptional antiterminator NusG
MNNKKVFCLFCETSQENKVELYLKKLGFNVISTFAERNIIVDGKIKNIFRSVMPGYVFFEYGGLLDGLDWKEICKMPCIYYPLKYGDNENVLRGKDLEFVNWLRKNNGIIKISKVIVVGNKIQVLEGPLKDYEGMIIKVNKRQKCAAIKLDGEGIEKVIWLSYEYIS